jgi:hypothetical protein
MAIFSDLIKKVMEVLMDDFCVYGKTFDCCLPNLDRVMKRCQLADFVPQLGEVSFHGPRRNCPWA